MNVFQLRLLLPTVFDFAPCVPINFYCISNVFRSSYVHCHSHLSLILDIRTNSFGWYDLHASPQPIGRQRRHFRPMGGETGADGYGIRRFSDH